VDDHDAFTYRVLTQTDGLDEFFRIVGEYILDPTVDEAAFDVARSKLTQSRELEPDGMNEGYRALYRLLYPEQPRFHAPSMDEITSARSEPLQRWLEQPVRRGFLEVTVVGDIEEEALLELFAKTIGALPTRREEKLDFEQVRSIRLDSVSGRETIEFQSSSGDNAASVIVWTIQDELSLRESASLYLLSSVLENRIRDRVRQGMGASYSPTVSYITFAAYNTLRHLRADVDCSKQDAQRILDVVFEIADDVSAGNIVEDELLAAVAPLEEGLKQAWNDNSYLLQNVLYGAQEYPDVIENALRYRDGLLSTITLDEVKAVAERFLVSDKALAVAIVPESGADIAEAPDWDPESKVGNLR